MNAVNPLIWTVGQEEGEARRWHGSGDIVTSGSASTVIIWMESSTDSVCWPHASPHRSASGPGADLSIPQSAYHEYESAAEDCAPLGPGFWPLPQPAMRRTRVPHAVVPARRAPARASPPVLPSWACWRTRGRQSGWQETESSACLNQRMDQLVRRQSPAERRPLPHLHSGITRPSHG